MENAQKSSADIHLSNIPGKDLIMNHPKLIKYRMILLYLSSSDIGTKLKNDCNDIMPTSSSILLILVPPRWNLTLWLSSFWKSSNHSSVGCIQTQEMLTKSFHKPPKPNVKAKRMKPCVDPSLRAALKLFTACFIELHFRWTFSSLGSAAVPCWYTNLSTLSTH